MGVPYTSDPRSFDCFLRKEMMVIHAWVEPDGQGWGIYQKKDKTLALVTAGGVEVRPITLAEARTLKAEHPLDYRDCFI